MKMRAQKTELPKTMETDEITTFEATWGEMHVEYDVFKKRFDVTPYLKGLPNDRDSCPHWGIVVKGKGKLIYDGKEETFQAGDVYYAPPGHTGVFEEGTELWEFSPQDKLQKTMEVIAMNMAVMRKVAQEV
jgi:mannose-6-phosphate isomerase-like protein (cupin superfamily)